MGNEKNTMAKIEGGVTAAELEQELRKAQPAPETTAQESEEVIEAKEKDHGEGIQFELVDEPYKVNGKQYYSYYVPLDVDGLFMKLEVKPKNSDKEKNTFERLEKIFDIAESRTGKRKHWLTVQKKSMKDNDGKRSTYLTYQVSIVGSLGIPIIVPVDPYGASNKVMLQNLYEQRVAGLL